MSAQARLGNLTERSVEDFLRVESHHADSSFMCTAVPPRQNRVDREKIESAAKGFAGIIRLQPHIYKHPETKSAVAHYLK